MGTTVPGSTAFSIRWHLSSSDWWKPYAEITPNKADYKASISSIPVGSYGPSFTSMITVPDSRARAVCYWSAGMFSATTGPPERGFQGLPTEHEKDFPIPRAGWARPDLDQDGSPVSGLLLSRSGVRKSPCSRRMEPFQR